MKKHTIIPCLLLTCLIFLGASVIGYQDWQLRGSAPVNPASGYFRVWADNTGQYFKCLTSSGTACYWDPKATSSTPGIVQTDGSTITNSSGTISCTTATTSQLGCVKPDGSTITISGGVISSTGGGGGGSGLIATKKVTTSQSTSRTTYVDLTTADSLSFSLSTASKVLVQYSAILTINNTHTCLDTVNIDGTNITDGGLGSPFASNDWGAMSTPIAYFLNSSWQYLTSSLGSGSHTIDIKHRTDGATCTWANRILVLQTSP